MDASLKKISDFTEVEFLGFVSKIYYAEYKSASEYVDAVFEFERLVQNAYGCGIIFFPKNDYEKSPEGIVKEVKEWRKANGMSVFKKEMNFESSIKKVNFNYASGFEKLMDPVMHGLIKCIGLIVDIRILA